MIALAVAVHPISAKEVVPTVIRYMEPFFKVNERVEQFVSAKVRETGEKRRLAAVEDGFAEVKALVKRSGSILRPFGEAVVGGSSQAVGSPANAARIAHALAKGRPKRIVIEMSTELFARRTINVPAILMCGLYGSSTADATAYAGVMDRVATEGVVVEVKETPTYQLQKITIEASESGSMVETFNRGGGRLVLLKAQPSLGLAQEAAKSLGIVLIDE
jgi:L-serine dehydratase